MARRAKSPGSLGRAKQGEPDEQELGDPPYDLRHAFASLQVRAGLSTPDLAEQMGHSPQMTPATYAHAICELKGLPRVSAEPRSSRRGKLVDARWTFQPAPGGDQRPRKVPICRDGEAQNRTGDTTIFRQSQAGREGATDRMTMRSRQGPPLSRYLQMPVDARGFRTLRPSGVQNGGVRAVRATVHSRGADFRIFRYEIRLWRNGHIPDVAEAVESPRRLAREKLLRAGLDQVSKVPTAVWGRDEARDG